MAGKSVNSFGSKNFAPGPPATRYNVSGKNREFYTFENAPGIGAYATGGTIIDGGDGYIYHIFTGSGTFAVNRPPAAIDSVDYLVVAGGGGAAPAPAPGANAGGGGGGFLSGNIPVSAQSYPISIGGGGPSSPGVPGVPRNGSPSTAFGLTATGGGGGAGSSPVVQGGAPGGSSGGGYGTSTGTGNTPATIPRQGYPGGSGIPGSGVVAGGGGGAGGVGSNATVPTVPVGGAGGPGRIAPEFPSTIISKVIPSPVLPAWQPLVSSGGYAAGGHGVNVPAPLQRTSPSNSGYGGQTGGTSGGSGIVCVRYKKNVPYTRATGGTIEPSTNPEHIGVVRHIFTGPGTFEVTDPTLQYIDYLAVAGGGGGGGPAPIGGGGGAGGFVTSIHTSTTTPTSIPEAYPWNTGTSVQVGKQYPVVTSSYPIGIGTGGNASTAGNNTTIGNPGVNQIIASGGGRGATAPGTGGAGGSGGGSAITAPAPPTSIPGGSATPSPLIQGNTGGTAGPSPVATSGGGGGAGAASPGNSGGVGWYSVLSPSSYGTSGPLTPSPLYRYFAGGGGNGSGFGGGSGGGGNGASGSGIAGTPGTTNTGGGGGGGFASSGGTGGPGIVIIQYPE